MGIPSLCPQCLFVADQVSEEALHKSKMGMEGYFPFISHGPGFFFTTNWPGATLLRHASLYVHEVSGYKSPQAVKILQDISNVMRLFSFQLQSGVNNRCLFVIHEPELLVTSAVASML